MTTLVTRPWEPNANHAGASLLEANLAALALRSPRVADRVRLAAPHPRLKWIATGKDGAWSAELDGRALASRRAPVEEGERLAGTVDFAASGIAAVIGFGLGYHVAALARRAGNHSLVLVYEPDVALLRAVFEHADFTDWLRAGRVFLFSDAEDAAALSESLAGLEALVGLGIAIVEHAPSLPRLGESAGVFAATLTRVVAAFRTQVVTTMTQMEVTIRNLLMNLDRYAGGAGVGDLAGAARGFPAVVVSAGPSLERNLHLLTQPGVRERAVIIAVQTVLKPMLARGIRPHFVTALDFHEISRRFYEGLTPADVEGITLVAEPKANPAILDAFPGAIRLVGAEALDLLLEPELAGDHGRLPPGATVAHLAYYLARHLACDPVILVGQDLAFTDGQYYAAGAAIHDVWATELNPFNTLEMMEWERIARWRGHLRKIEDHRGRRVYTDEQMATYLAQFERDFLADARRGLTTIDATEGGARKAHTIVMPLREALERFAPAGVLSPRLAAPPRRATSEVRHQVRARLRAIRADARKIAAHSRRARGLLERMLECRDGDRRINRLIEEVQALGEHVRTLEPAYGLVHRMNQAGTFRRYRADRAIALDAGLSPIERQRRQIERDIANVAWLAEAAESLSDLLDAAAAALDGAPKRTRDPIPAEETPDAPAVPAVHSRVAAVIPVDVERSALGFPRDLSRPIAGQPALAWTLARLARCKSLDAVVLVTDDRARLAALMGDPPASLHVEVMEVEPDRLHAARRSVAAARLWSPTCWRGGLGHMTCFDEVFDPALVGRALDEFGFDAAIILGPDWCAVDPALCDAVIDRHRESPARLPLTFTQAPPGLAPCVVARGLCRKLEEGRAAGDPMATLGGVLGFRPMHPRLDPIAEACCVQIPAEVRSIHARFIADSPTGVRAVERLLAHGASFDRRDNSWLPLRESIAPQHLILELRGTAPGDRMGASDAARLLREFGPLRPDGVVTFAGRGDPLDHPDLPAVVRAARVAGVAGVHVRTAAAADESAIDALLAAEPTVVSVDLHAADEPTYHALTGTDHFQRSVLNTERMLASRQSAGGLPTPWIVPRVARRDATIDQIEGMYDRALVFAGAGTIDPPPRTAPGERIAPLPKPAGLIARDAATRMWVRCDGVVIADESDPECAECRPVGNALEDGLAGAWSRLLDRRRSAWDHHGPGHPDLRTLY